MVGGLEATAAVMEQETVTTWTLVTILFIHTTANLEWPVNLTHTCFWTC